LIGEAKAIHRRSRRETEGSQATRTRVDSRKSIRENPKPADLCLGRMKPREIGVEVRSRIDVQIIGVTWV
jgi:hypothetical protein